ncbi:MAG: tetratricopeptide repeat protein [Acidobacteria bacterium]|nr:tetratricopeptide repeat protein [Acidobacteriota bacterium]
MPHRDSREQSSSVPSGIEAVRNLWTPREAYLLALVCLLSGLVLGYLFHGSSPAVLPAPVTTSAPSAANPEARAPMPTAQTWAPLAAPLLAALKVEPKNAATLVQLGNLYYDHQVYPEAIQYYTQALEVTPKNVDVRTDLGTAYWYSGFPEKAVAEYERSLALNSMHVNTLFNMGIVRLEGLKDAKGAVRYFEKVLSLNASPQQREKAQELLAKAKAMKS